MGAENTKLKTKRITVKKSNDDDGPKLMVICYEEWKRA